MQLSKGRRGDLLIINQTRNIRPKLNKPQSKITFCGILEIFNYFRESII